MNSDANYAISKLPPYSIISQMLTSKTFPDPASLLTSIADYTATPHPPFVNNRRPNEATLLNSNFERAQLQFESNIIIFLIQLLNRPHSKPSSTNGEQAAVCQ